MPSPQGYRITARALDLGVLLCLLVWLVGGIPHGGAKPWLSHGADPRRAALLILGVLALFPALNRESTAVRAAKAMGRALTHRRWALYWGGFAWAAILVCLQALALRFPLWDTGIFHQILWSVSHGEGFRSSASGAGDFLKDHLSPTLALLAPIFRLSDGGCVLALLHVACVYLGIAAWIRLAERVPRNTPAFRATLATATVVFAVAFDSFWSNFHWGFHENAPAFAALSWAFCLIFEEGPRRDWLALLAVLVAAFSKEILLLDVALALIVWRLSPQRPLSRWLRALLPVLAAACVALFVVFEHSPHPAGKNYFERYYSYLGHGLSEALANLGRAPLLVYENIGPGKLAAFALAVFLPWLALPFAAPRGYRRWLWAAAPSAAAMALSTYAPLRDARFHYVLELWPVLAALTILALGKIGSPRLAWAWALLALFALDTDPWQQALEYGPQAVAQSELRARLREIPAGESVAAHELTGPWLASRLELTRYPDACARWLVLPQSVAEGRDPALPSLAAWSERCHKPAANPVWTSSGWVAYRWDE